MRHVKFNQFERVAGFFVLGAIALFVFSLIGIAVRQGWFESRVAYSTTFDLAEGVHPGATVQIAGLRAGTVEEVELTQDNKVLVHFTVLAKFAERVKVDSDAILIRPFLIGERVLEITVGTPGALPQPHGTAVRSRETMDLMTLLSGRNLGESLEAMSEMIGNLKGLAEAFLDKDRTASMINMFDRIDPLLRNLNTMSVEVIKLSKQATKDENMGKVMGELAVTTRELNALIPMINKKAPKMGEDFEKLVANMAVLTEQFKVFIPALAEVGPELPHASRRAVEALDEAVVLLKAMQKSFFLRGNVEDVREDEKKRKPASHEPVK